MPILQSALLFTAIAAVSASPVLFSSPYGGGLQTRQDGAASSPAYSVPQDNDNAIRAADVSTKRETFLLGPSLGVGPTYPAGSLGKVYTDADEVIATVESDAQQDITTGDRARAKANIAKVSTARITLDGAIVDSMAVQWTQDVGRLHEALRQ